ncbi:MAG: ATP-binding protein [Arcicella sp.]|nr:ATP-binding protein [Arcicella sp.]
MEIQRKLKEVLFNYLVSGKVNIVYGARRVGKTFLIKKIVEELDLPYLWLNGDLPDTQDFLSERNLGKYKSILSGKELLVIDEAQVVPKIGLALKIIIDEIPNLKIIASGSSAFDLNNNLDEPLVGRAHWHEMFPVSQEEISFHENYLETRRNLDERLIYGSYPEVCLLLNIDDKENYLRELVSSYLLKDIISFDGIRNSSKVFDLLKLIAFQMGKEVSLLELAKQLELSKNTVEKYLDLLEKVYVLKQIKGFSRNLRKEITKSSRWYFWDNGVRNAVIGDFKSLSFRNDVGELWENYLMMERLKKNKYARNYKETYFWRTYDQQEIDCIEVKNQEIEAFEFKWGNKKANIPKAFADAYSEAKFTVISKENYLDFIQ